MDRVNWKADLQPKAALVCFPTGRTVDESTSPGFDPAPKVLNRLNDWALSVASSCDDDVTAARRLRELISSAGQTISDVDAAELIDSARVEMAEAKEQQEAARPFVIRWRRALVQSDVPSTRRWVLVALSHFAGREGTGAFPSTRTLAEYTALSRRCVEGHLRIADEEGWISRTERKRAGRPWARMEYVLTLPHHEENEVPHVDLTERGESDAHRGESDTSIGAGGSHKREGEVGRGERETMGRMTTKIVDSHEEHDVPHVGVEEVL